jgi:DNA-binding protein HU-beta
MSTSKAEIIQRAAEKSSLNPQLVETVLDAVLEEIYSSLKQNESVSLKNFGTFYIRAGREGSVFKFNPSQRLRKLFGWASTYKGES